MEEEKANPNTVRTIIRELQSDGVIEKKNKYETFRVVRETN